MARKNKTKSDAMKVLFVTSEAFPLIKTGGLADVSHSLPNALHGLGNDVRVVLPAYREVLQKVGPLSLLGWLPARAEGDVRVFETRHAAFDMPIWLIDCAPLFDRSGNPYTDADGHDWHDNAERFSVFSRAAALLGIDALETGWKPDVVHANDWQTGLVPAFLAQQHAPPQRVYTIHNLAYDNQVDYAGFQALRLPGHWWSIEYGEFYDRFSMMKCGLTFSDRITTVSPTYAKEICTPEYGYGYAGVLQAQAHKLHGILNGIDTDYWDPRTDSYLAENYGSGKKLWPAKAANRQALMQALKAELDDQAPLIGFVGRLVHQKGVDLLLHAAERVIAESNACFAIIGTGEKALEEALKQLAQRHPDRIAYFVGYSEAMAHLLEAGSDLFAMPSRYEPCGLNQLYSLRYGTPPVVRRTGGLADTVVDVDEGVKGANGFVFDRADADALADVLLRALRVHQDSGRWEKLVRTGMRRVSDWQSSAQAYLSVYRLKTHQQEQ